MTQSSPAPSTGGQILIDALRIHGTRTVFCVPGESFLAVLDALYLVRDEISLVVCRQEGGAAHMAEANGKLTGEPGVCFVTRGPGSTNASIAVHTAHQDSTPLIVFVGQVAPTSGTMGYGLPAAVAAKIEHPERTVVCFAGDGCFLMNGQELATAVQYGAAVIVVVVNNGMYGSIRMHQERHCPHHVWGTELANPDFSALARAYGAHGETVEKTEDFPAALIELRVNPELLSPKPTVQGLRDAAKH